MAEWTKTWQNSVNLGKEILSQTHPNSVYFARLASSPAILVKISFCWGWNFCGGRGGIQTCDMDSPGQLLPPPSRLYPCQPTLSLHWVRVPGSSHIGVNIKSLTLRPLAVIYNKEALLLLKATFIRKLLGISRCCVCGINAGMPYWAVFTESLSGLS